LRRLVASISDVNETGTTYIGPPILDITFLAYKKIRI